MRTKPLFFLATLLFAFSTTKAQNYVPFLGDTSSWSEHENITLSNTWESCTAIYHTDGQTTIGGLDYFIINKRRVCSWADTQEPWIGGSFAEPDALIGYLRDDTVAHQWYWRVPNANQEQLLFDFSVQETDTLDPSITGLTFSGAYVFNIDTALYLDGEYRRTWVIYAINPNGTDYELTTVTEGIGNSMGWNKTMYEPFEQIFTLNCYQHDSLILYGGNCQLDVGLNEVSNQKWVTNLYPNPTTNQTTLYLDRPQQVEVQVCDLSGRTLSQFKSNQTQQVEIDLSSYMPGVYFVRVVDAANRTRVHKVWRQ